MWGGGGIVSQRGGNRVVEVRVFFPVAGGKKKSIKWPIVPTPFLLRQLAGRASSPVQQKADNGGCCKSVQLKTRQRCEETDSQQQLKGCFGHRSVVADSSEPVVFTQQITETCNFTFDIVLLY